MLSFLTNSRQQASLSVSLNCSVPQTEIDKALNKQLHLLTNAKKLYLNEFPFLFESKWLLNLF